MKDVTLVVSHDEEGRLVYLLSSLNLIDNNIPFSQVLVLAKDDLSLEQSEKTLSKFIGKGIEGSVIKRPAEQNKVVFEFCESPITTDWFVLLTDQGFVFPTYYELFVKEKKRFDTYGTLLSFYAPVLSPTAARDGGAGMIYNTKVRNEFCHSLKKEQKLATKDIVRKYTSFMKANKYDLYEHISEDLFFNK